MINIGITQGRLTPSLERGIQFFPFENWANEFYVSEELGINEIEWIFDYPNYEENPLWSNTGIVDIVDVINKTGVAVNAVCWDYFMRRPFYKFFGEEKENVLNENKEFFLHILKGVKQIGAGLIEIPTVDNSSIVNEKEEEDFVGFMQWAGQQANGKNILLDVESDYPPDKFKILLSKIGCGVKANYDSGNSSGLGYDHSYEIMVLKDLICNIHIKDRSLDKVSMPFGTGNADFDKLFSALKSIEYKGSFILQGARGEDGKEKENITGQIRFLSDYLEKYNLL